MPHPAGGYFADDGGRVPGVTTVLGRFKEAGPLIHWAWKLGIEGKDYRKVRDEAAGIGTLAHALVEADIHKAPAVSLEGYTKDQIEAALRSFDAFKQWAKGNKFKVTDTEVQMVSQTYRFGGTIDGCYMGKKRVIWDIKTSASVYPEYLCQLAAYRWLWNETHPDDPCEPGGHIVRFDKINGDFGHFFFSDLDDAWMAFLHMRALYDLMKKIETRVK
jgi:hypothetical protein